MSMTFCPGCGSPLLLETQRFCATCGFDLEGLRERARGTQAPSDRAGPAADVPSTVAAAPPAEPGALEALPPQPAPIVVPAAALPVRAPETWETPAGPAASARPEAAPERQPVQAASLVTRSAEQTAPSGRTASRSRRRPLLILAGVLLVLAVAGLGYIVLSKPGSGSAQPQSLGLAPASLDPDAPAFPAPAGSMLLSAVVEGSGTGAYRLAAWQSGADYTTTAAFYTGLHDPRWQASGSPVTTPQATNVSFSDGSGVFASADVEVDRTDPVRIEVRFLSRTSPSAGTFAPGPAIAFGPLPAATSLPNGFPSAFVPAGTTLVDASSLGSTYFAIFGGSVDPAVYQKQIASVATVTATRAQSGATVIDFTYDGNLGEVVVDPASSQVSIEVTK